MNFPGEIFRDRLLIKNTHGRFNYEDKQVLIFLNLALYFKIITIYLQSLKEGRKNKLKKWQIINHQ